MIFWESQVGKPKMSENGVSKKMFEGMKERLGDSLPVPGHTHLFTGGLSPSRSYAYL